LPSLTAFSLSSSFIDWITHISGSLRKHQDDDCTRSSLRLAHVLRNNSTFLASFVEFQQQQPQSCRTVIRYFQPPRILVFRSLLLKFLRPPCSIRSTTHIRQLNHIRLRLGQVW
jgi:hypothetical protein